MASTNLRIDGYGIDPQFPLDENRTLRGFAEVDRPVVHGRRFGHRTVRQWTLTWEPCTLGQIWLIRTAFEAVGKVGAVNFIPPDDTGIVLVRFSGDLEYDRLSATSYRATVEVEELIR